MNPFFYVEIDFISKCPESNILGHLRFWCPTFKLGFALDSVVSFLERAGYMPIVKDTAVYSINVSPTSFCSQPIGLLLFKLKNADTHTFLSFTSAATSFQKYFTKFINK